MTTTSSMPQGARNFFFYFLGFVLLYTVAINLGGVLFNVINRAFPLAVEYYGEGRMGGGALRFNLSALIIGAPIYLWLASKVHREEQKHTAMLHSAIRRWLTYITLIVTALIVIGDLIALVNNLLGGETTLRFILKALVVLGIAGAIFSYYLSDVRLRRSGEDTKSRMPRTYFQASIAVILIVIVTGFFFIESPTVQRMRRQDEARLSHLQQIENAIYQYASINNGALPSNLEQVSLPEGITADPITKEPYVYEPTTASNYRLCATFETSNKELNQSEPFPYYPNWYHEKGRACFERSVDPFVPGRDIPAQKPLPVD